MNAALSSPVVRAAAWAGAFVLVPVASSVGCVALNHFDVPPVQIPTNLPVGIKLDFPKVEFTPGPFSALGRDDATKGASTINLPAPIELTTSSQSGKSDFAKALRTPARVAREFEARTGGTPASFEDRIDYSAALMFLGRAPEAVKVLVALEVEQPGKLMTAVNLGTAYELTGNLDAAVKWISIGIERDPKAFGGTEWLHVAILRAKINLQRDAAWLTKHSVLDVADRHDTGEILAAIDTQLNERLQFVKPSDPTVCDLFYQAAVRASGDRRTQYCRASELYGSLRKAELAQLEKS